jgi:hypothetical protein
MSNENGDLENGSPAPIAHRKCHLIALKTALETKARDTLIDVYITVVPVKNASGALK